MSFNASLQANEKKNDTNNTVEASCTDANNGIGYIKFAKYCLRIVEVQ